MFVRFFNGDTLIMKKAHPCGSDKMIVIHAGSDVKVRCAGCSHDIIISRIKLEKNIRQVISNDEKKD